MSFRRRSSLGGTPLRQELLAEADPVDEARERRVRQKKRQSVVGLTPTHDEKKESKTNDGSSNGAFLAEHYNNCIKLSAENKINVKNAFSLQLIDYLADKFLSKKQEENNFQAASCALDASTKIYAYRVDSVHSAALKLAGGVGSTADEVKTAAGNDSAPDEEFDEAPARKKNLKRSSKNTIEKNLKNITLSKMEMNFDVDPLFKKTTSQYDSGGGGNYFVNTLFELNDDAQLVWDPDAPIYQSNFIPSHMPERSIPMNICLEALKASSICPTFQEFNFREWNLEEDDLNSSIIGFSQPMTSTQKDGEGGEHAFDIHAPVPEDFDDFTAADAVMDTNGVDDPVMESQMNVGLKGREALFSENLRDILSSVPLEYSYFDHSRMGSFAGPKHWKFRQPVVRAELNSDDKKGGSKKKNQKEDQPLEFSSLDEDSSALELVSRLMCKPKKTARLQIKTIQSWTEDKRMSPEELCYKGSDFVNLDLVEIIPSKLSEKGKLPQHNVDQTGELSDIGDYDYDNVNDAENFCPADMASSNYDEHRTMGPPDDPSMELDGLVSAPNKVEKINISYAKLAKKVDMKRLKYVEWDILRTEDDEKENLNDTNSGSTTALMNGTKTFSQLYKNLETSSKMPPKMIENLSVPLAFAALLHLCNENSLKLEGNQELTDFCIMQG